MRLFNTMTRRVEEFAPAGGRRVGLYTCGPTVYNYAHIGNFRTYVFEDVLRRHLRYSGYDVFQVMNITDVDDKTIRGSRNAGIPLKDYTKPFTDAFFSDLKTLGIEPAEVYPAATDHVEDMISMILKLIEKKHAYVSSDGCVYYDVGSFPAYGKLAHLDFNGLRSGSRVAHDEYDKENLADFALWKAWDEEDGDVAWDSPWGRGRPGWHIECSAMSIRHLGETFDIHTGGVDNIFPHHENEIAQSEGATGRQFVRYWVHSEHLQVEGRKMAKSFGNFYTLREVLEKGYSGREVRYVLISGHYRQKLNFTFAALDAARPTLARLDECRARLAALAGASKPGDAPGWARAGDAAFGAAMDDDLNVPEALAAVFGVVHEANRAIDSGAMGAGAASAVEALFDKWDTVLNVLRAPEVEPPAEVLELAEQRAAARAAKMWDEADRLRAKLTGLGWEIRDTAEGAKLKPRQQ
ncbi:MAG: cysteine--tRNA ligase [Lentisphaerae bacterium]|nr:cysteine--tRNA ligase [Lentisphaerota bacterium]